MDEWLKLIMSTFPGRLKRNEYYVYDCPYCGNPRRNFQINIVSHVFHCWSCNRGGHLGTFFHDFNLDYSLLPERGERKESFQVEKERKEAVMALPEEADDILSSIGCFAKQALDYLKIDRGLTERDIFKYGIKYCYHGEYAGRVIVPLYESGDLVYFIARSYGYGVKPYLNPEMKRKDILPILWGDDPAELVIVEGVFDAIAVHKTGRTVLPMIGKALSKEQIARLVDMNFSKLIVMTDADAYSDGILLAKRLAKEELIVECARLPEEDADEISTEELVTILRTAKKPSMVDFVTAKMKM